MHSKTRIIAIAVLAILVLLLGACMRQENEPMSTMDADSEGAGQMQMERDMSTGALAPLVGGFYEGGEISFIHTEASDAQVAEMLTEMMGPQVVLVPELAQTPPELLANVYVFRNGVEGNGPFGFQPDVFDAVPGDENYRPLRSVNLVEWNEDATPRLLRSAAEIQEAETAGELSVIQPGIVVNMPVLTWPDGSR
ncbi:MAG TPA: hypothetical protein VF177_09830 [Anaerolineae bacterium]